MASWLETLLNSVQGGQGALMDAYAQSNPVTGGSMPLPADTPADAAPAAAPDPFQSLLAGLTRRKAGTISMLEQLAQGGKAARLQKPIDSQGRTGLGAYAQLTSHGPRAGQAHLSYEGPGGYMYNAYFDPKTGKRQVFRFKP